MGIDRKAVPGREGATRAPRSIVWSVKGALQVGLVIALAATMGCSAGPSRGGSFGSPPGGPTAGSTKTAEEISKQIYVTDGPMETMQYAELGKIDAQYATPFGDTGGATAGCREALKQRAYEKWGMLVNAIVKFSSQPGGGEWWCQGIAVRFTGG